MSQLSVFLQRTITGVLWLVGAVIFFRWLLGPLMPFLLALALSAMAEPLVQRVRRHLKVRRSFAAALVTTFFLLVLGGGAGLVLGRLVLELRQWSARLPEAIAGFPAVWNGLIDRVEDWYASSPAFLRSALDALAEQLMEDGPSLAGDVGGWLMGAASSLLAALPDAGLFLMTTVLAVYFTSLSYPAILAFLKRQLPTAWQAKCRDAANCFRSTILKWLRAECLLLLATFVLLLIGFLWMRLDYALLAAAFTALVDALPVLGTGTVLVPWALGCMLLGDTGRGLALLTLYAVGLIVHTLLEPRLLAGQVDLPPITALLAMYLGFHFLGVGGMILLPLCMLLLKQFQDAGVVKLWR
ncbi:MAG: sporulation integral membrane protein YtvI [Oscillospiraceae bacterium]|nr:sporulation integral membrane protein YtvI [Oscillospiraceae bacterium]